MTIPIGLILTLACMLGVFAAMGGKISVIWQPWEYVIILGASIGTMCFPPCEVAPGLGNFTVFSTLPPIGGCVSLAGAVPAPFAFTDPGYPYALPPITFQVIVQTSATAFTVGNALVLEYN